MAEHTSTTAQITPGSLVRINGVIWQVAVRETDEETGEEYVLCDAPQIGSFGRDFTLDEVEFVASATEARARRLAALEDVQSLVMKLCGEDVENLSIDEAERDGEFDVLLHGSTEFGQRVGIRVCIVTVTEEDF